MEEWVSLDDFPGYSVSDQGRVRNDERYQIMSTNQNQSGLAMVGLTKNGVQYKRSLALMVAKLFVSQPYEHYNTPINLNGDRLNCRAENLVWRPRWFATKYHRQFDTMSPVLRTPIIDIKRGDRYADTIEVAVTNGLLFKDVVLSVVNKTYTPFTFQWFEREDGDF